MSNGIAHLTNQIGDVRDLAAETDVVRECDSSAMERQRTSRYRQLSRLVPA
jgi:hypothetical protein